MKYSDERFRQILTTPERLKRKNTKRSAVTLAAIADGVLSFQERRRSEYLSMEMTMNHLSTKIRWADKRIKG
jgi:hypothetical protein